MITRSRFMAASEAAGELDKRADRVSDHPYPATTAIADPTFVQTDPTVMYIRNMQFRM